MASETYSDKLGLGGVHLLSVEVVVDKSKAGASATTELCLEAEHGDTLFLGLHHLSELLLDLRLRDVGHLGVDKIDSLNSHKWVRLDSTDSGTTSSRPRSVLTTCFLAKRGFLKNLRT